jgi:AraC-like DNA-binding protein
MSLEQLKLVLVGKLGELTRTVSSIALNQDIKSLMYVKSPLRTKDRLTVREAQKDLMKYKLSNNFVEEIYVYIHNSDFVFSSGYKYNSDELRDVALRDFRLGYDELAGLTRVKNHNILRILDGKVLLIHSLYLNDITRPTGTLMISLNGEVLRRLLKNLEWTHQGDIFLITGRDESFAMSRSATAEPVFRYRALQSAVRAFNEKGDPDVAVLHLPSDVLSLEYVSRIPTGIFTRKVQYIKNMIYIYVAICMLVGICAAFFFARRNYRPVLKLRQLLSNRIGSPEDELGNDFKFMERALRNLVDESSSVTAILRQQAAAQRNNLLVRLLKGRVRDTEAESVHGALDSHGIRFDGDCFFVVAFRFANLDSKLFGEHMDDSETLDLIRFVVKNVVEELFNERCVGHMADIDGLMAIIVNCRAENGCPDRVEVDGILFRALSFLKTTFELSLFASVSDTHYGLAGLPEAWSEALEVIEYNVLLGIAEPVSRYETFRPRSSCSIYDSCNLEKERLLANCVRARDYREAKRILSVLFAVSFPKDFPSIQLAKCRVFGLVNTVLNAIGEMRNGREEIEFLDRLDPATRLLGTKSIAELKMQVEDIFDQIIEFFRKREKKPPAWVDDAEVYVRRHFQEPDLSISGIAEQTGLCVSWLSKAYKKHQGVGLLDYIHTVRIEKAKELLSSSMNVKQIASKVGYIESKAFIRSFRHYEGITPGRFRETLPEKPSGDARPAPAAMPSDRPAL